MIQSRSPRKARASEDGSVRRCCAASVEALPEGFIVESNIFYHNRRVECDSSFDDLQREEFYRQAPPLLKELSSHPALGAARAFGELQEDDD